MAERKEGVGASAMANTQSGEQGTMWSQEELWRALAQHHTPYLYVTGCADDRGT